MDFYVTTSLHADAETILSGTQWAQAVQGHFISRDGRSISALLSDLQVPALCVFTAAGPEIVSSKGRHAFQLSMAELRIQQLRKGRIDHFMEAIGHSGPVRLLDCTCGFASDSIVASFALPKGSSVMALEVSPMLFAVTAWGLKHFIHDKDDVTAALRRINLTYCDYRTYLRNIHTDNPDVIYFDPMFSYPIYESPQFLPVRSIMDHGELDKLSIDLALQKARKKVIIKGRKFHRLHEWYPDVAVFGGTYSRIKYAVLECSCE